MELRLREISRANSLAPKETTIELVNGLPSCGGSRKQHEDANRVVWVKWWRLNEVDDHTLNSAVLRALVT